MLGMSQKLLHIKLGLIIMLIHEFNTLWNFKFALNDQLKMSQWPVFDLNLLIVSNCFFCKEFLVSFHSFLSKIWKMWNITDECHFVHYRLLHIFLYNLERSPVKCCQVTTFGASYCSLSHCILRFPDQCKLTKCVSIFAFSYFAKTRISLLFFYC